ncbi:MAG: hypothetical protein WCP55_03840 [Lentisphaerota bacterium]
MDEKTRFEVFAEEIVKASDALGMSHVRKTISNYVPKEFEEDAKDGMGAGFIFRGDQNCCEVFLNPNSDDDPRYDAWHEMAELSLIDIEHFCEECVKKRKFDKEKWESLAHAMVNRIVSAARPELLHIIYPPQNSDK